jgi:Flp pilus assembly protein TadG
VAVEFALIVPLLLLILLGIIEFGRAYNVQISLTHSARETVRNMAIHQEWDDAVSKGIASAPSIGLDVSHFTLSANSCTTEPDAGVTIRYPFETLTGIAGDMVLEGKATMRCGG